MLELQAVIHRALDVIQEAQLMQSYCNIQHVMWKYRGTTKANTTVSIKYNNTQKRT